MINETTVIKSQLIGNNSMMAFKTLLLMMTIACAFVLLASRPKAQFQSQDAINLRVTRNTSANNSNAVTLEYPDTNRVPSFDVLIDGESNSNAALFYESHWKSLDRANHWSVNGVTDCDVNFPNSFFLLYNNYYWQQFHSRNGLVVYLLNAYYDSRQIKPSVRIIASNNHQNEVENLRLRFLLWFDNKRNPLLSGECRVRAVWPRKWQANSPRKSGTFGTVLITCDIPSAVRLLIPKAVSVIETNSCPVFNLTNALRVIYNKPRVRHEFAVCVKSLNFVDQDLSVRLIEWLEMQRILGARKVFLYKFSTHKNMDKVLDYYVKQNFVDLKLLSLPGNQPNIPQIYQPYHKQHYFHFAPQEMVELNDCLYRNLYSYKYLINYDIDEIIVPTKADNWSDLMAEIKNSLPNKKLFDKYGYFENINAYVYQKLETNERQATDGRLQTIPPYMFTMRHIHRQDYYRQNYLKAKCFLSVDNVEVAYNHYPLKCLNRDHDFCDGHTISTNKSYFLHFRVGVDLPLNCQMADKKQCAIRDTVMWKYYDRLDAAMNAAIREIFN